jgi:hypothetical protein
MKLEMLQKAQAIATILSLVAVPIAIAWGAQNIEARNAELGTRKDYVGMALGILAKGSEDKVDLELRQWAVKVIDQYAPAPLPPSLAQRLTSGESTLPQSCASLSTVFEQISPNAAGGKR